MARKAKDLELLKLLFQRQMASSDAISRFAEKWAASPEPAIERAAPPTTLSTSWLGEPEEEQPEPQAKPEPQVKAEPEKPKPAEPLMSKQRTKSILPYGKKVGDFATYTSGKGFVEGMVKRGWTPEEAAGAAGNVHVESGFRPGIKSSVPGENSFGYLQWNKERLRGLKNMAAQTGRDWTSPDAQMDYIHMERTGESVKFGGGDERTAYKRALAGGGTAAEIAERFGRFVERPADLSQSVGLRRAAATAYRGSV